jgi:hypothetical protein
MNCCAPTFIIVNNYYVFSSTENQHQYALVPQANGISGIDTCSTTTDSHPAEPPPQQSMQCSQSANYGSPTTQTAVVQTGQETRLARTMAESAIMENEQNLAGR